MTTYLMVKMGHNTGFTCSDCGEIGVPAKRLYFCRKHFAAKNGGRTPNELSFSELDPLIANFQICTDCLVQHFKCCAGENNEPIRFLDVMGRLKDEGYRMKQENLERQWDAQGKLQSVQEQIEQVMKKCTNQLADLRKARNSTEFDSREDIYLQMVTDIREAVEHLLQDLETAGARFDEILSAEYPRGRVGMDRLEKTDRVEIKSPTFKGRPKRNESRSSTHSKRSPKTSPVEVSSV